MSSWRKWWNYWERRGDHRILRRCVLEKYKLANSSSPLYLYLFIYRPVANLAHDVGLYTFVMKISPIAWIIKRSYIYFHLMVFGFLLHPAPLNWWDCLFLREWKSLKNIYETKTILPNLSKKCMHFCDWSCISDDAFNAFAAKMFIYRIHFVSLYMYL